MKKLLWCCAIAVLFSAFYALKSWPDDQVHVFFCNVGQGDGILVTHQHFQMVIDGGPDNQISECLRKFLPWNDRTLEVVVATHSDSDHVTGLISVLQDYQIGTLYTEAYGSKSQTWEKFRRAVQKAVQHGTQLHQPKAGEQIRIDSLLSILIVNPREKRGSLSIFQDSLTETQLSAIYEEETKEFESTNNEAIALFLTIKQVSIALTSDIETPVELALRSTSLLQDVDVLKVGHHGSKFSTGEPFLDILRPEVAVISVGKKNRYGHPSPEVVAELERRKVQIFRTDQMRTIEMITNGEKYWWRKHL